MISRPAPWRAALGYLALPCLLVLIAGCALWPERAPVQATATPVPTWVSPGAPALPPVSASDLIAQLQVREMPPRDYAALAASLRSTPGLAAPTSAPAGAALAIGATQSFWVADLDTVGFFTITATLRALGAHTQMWVQTDASVDQAALERSLRAFDERIYPTLRRLFGPERSPGIDGDTRLVILNAHYAGAAGYFSAANAYSRAANPYSNEREMFVMNLSALTPGTEPYESVLAHEFQHMIHWHQDVNEDAWVTEGASQLAEELCGYGWPTGPVSAFLGDPDVQLTTWSDIGDEMGAHYGAAYLFLRYFWERAGDDALRALIAEPANGLAGVDAALRASGTTLTTDQLLDDWIAANATNNPAQAPPYGYAEMTSRAVPQAHAVTLPFDYEGQVRQYGVDYIAIEPGIQGALQVDLAGQTHVRLVPNEPAGGLYQWWSNRGDASHSWLERTFDLTGITTATLGYDLWYDIEPGWDYAYVRASADGGATWRVLETGHGSDLNPVGYALGWGYTGRSGTPPAATSSETPHWVRDAVDLSPFTGGPILVRFDYVTDDAVNYAGLCLDNLALEAVGYTDDVEQGEDGWQAVGFIRHDNRLPQTFGVQLITLGGQPLVQTLEVETLGRGSWLLEPAQDGIATQRILAIAALAPVTTEPATYTLHIEQISQAQH